MSPIYHWILYVHVISAIASVGPFFILFPLITRMRTADEVALSHYIPSFRSAVRLCKHAGHLLVTSGIFMIWLGHWPWTTSWVVATVIVMVSSLYFIARAFSPTLRLLEAPHAERQPLVDKLRNALSLYVGLMLLMLGFMVMKPTLW